MITIFQHALEMMRDPAATSTELTDAAYLAYAKHRALFGHMWVAQDPGWTEITSNMRYNCIQRWVNTHRIDPPC